MTADGFSMWLVRFGAVVNTALAVCAVLIVLEMAVVSKELARLNNGMETIMEHDGDIGVIRDRLEKMEENIARITRNLPK